MWKGKVVGGCLYRDRAPPSVVFLASGCLLAFHCGITVYSVFSTAEREREIEKTLF